MLEKNVRFITKNYTVAQMATIVAIIKKGGRVISIGVNNKFRHTYKGKEENGYPKYTGLHAELAAIKGCKNKEKLKGATITVIGCNYTKKFLNNTKPCEACMRLIRSVGIKRVIYYKRIDDELKEFKIKL